MKSTSSSQKKNLQSILATNLKKLTITPPSDNNRDFDFSEVFGPLTPHHHHPNPIQSPPSTSTPSAFLVDPQPQVIHTRSHSYVGPSPRYTLSSSLPIQIPEIQEAEAETENEAESEEAVEEEEEEEAAAKTKIGPEDFEILRVVGKGAFGKVFLVSKKGRNDGIFAMKVMRKDTIIKKNHVDYMKAERDILTKVVHPFIVQLRYSFQVQYSTILF